MVGFRGYIYIKVSQTAGLKTILLSSQYIYLIEQVFKGHMVKGRGQSEFLTNLLPEGLPNLAKCLERTISSNNDEVTSYGLKSKVQLLMMKI